MLILRRVQWLAIILLASGSIAASMFLYSKARQSEIKYKRQLQSIQDAHQVKTIEYKKQLEDSSKQIEELKKQLQVKADEKARQALLKAAEANTPARVAQAVVPTAQAAPAPSSEAKMFIYMKESGNRTNAINASSGACGLGQALPCSKMPCSLSDYACQDAFFTKYMQSRYGTWENAKAFWLAHRWW